MEEPKLILTESDDHSLTSAMCSLCQTLFPTFKEKSFDANKELLERCFQQHVKAEHLGQPPPWLKASKTTCN
jgi:hypothetical protein